MADNFTMTKYTEEYLKAKSIYDLRKILRGLGGVPGGKGKADLIAAVLSILISVLLVPALHWVFILELPAVARDTIQRQMKSMLH